MSADFVTLHSLLQPSEPSAISAEGSRTPRSPRGPMTPAGLARQTHCRWLKLDDFRLLNSWHVPIRAPTSDSSWTLRIRLSHGHLFTLRVFLSFRLSSFLPVPSASFPLKARLCFCLACFVPLTRQPWRRVWASKKKKNQDVFFSSTFSFLLPLTCEL